jgi:hypothetical protein
MRGDVAIVLHKGDGTYGNIIMRRPVSRRLTSTVGGHAHTKTDLTTDRLATRPNSKKNSIKLYSYFSLSVHRGQPSGNGQTAESECPSGFHLLEERNDDGRIVFPSSRLLLDFWGVAIMAVITSIFYYSWTISSNLYLQTIIDIMTHFEQESSSLYIHQLLQSQQQQQQQQLLLRNFSPRCS